MNILEFHDFKLENAVKFHNTLNPELFEGTHLKPEVRKQLLLIADDFAEFLGLDNLKLKDITLSGSNANYTYTPFSDIDLHLVVDLSDVCSDEVYKELFNAKKNQYNDRNNIKIYGNEVEVYVQDSKDKHVTAGEYSVLKNKWNKLPVKREPTINERATRTKFIKLVQLAEVALQSGDRDAVEHLLKTIRRYRQAGLDLHGELGPENLAYKLLRNTGIIQQLHDYLDELHSQNLSLPEGLDDGTKPKSWDDYGVRVPQKKQPEQKPKEKFYSGWEDYFTNTKKQDNSKEKVHEASGYIPSEAEKDDPRFKTALTVDVKPDTMKKGAIAMGLGKISRAGIPQTANPSGKFKK